jgi:uncharacterized protein YdeI (YjbR/CyaY-like superfamily)
MKRFRTVDEFIAKTELWKAELTGLREIMLSTGLDETVKWGFPVYCYAGKNIVGIGSFKSYFGVWFFQGALLKDKKNKLINAQEGVTKSMRQLRFQSADDMDAQLIRSYVAEAIRLAKQGVKIPPNRNRPLEIPPELAAALQKSKNAKKAFEKLSASCQREYAQYIATAKQDATKQRRLQKILPMIAAGEKLNDKYRS